jgi:hypothetical protein
MHRAFAYDDCDIPADMTIAEFRARRITVRGGPPKLLRRLRRRRLDRDPERR